MNTTTDNEKWIDERLGDADEPVTADDMRAAIARGREQGRAEGADELAQLAAWRCDVTVALGRPQGTFYADVPKLIRDVVADRDRLAKRVADLESRLAIADKAEAHARAQVDAYHDIGATTRLGDVESRLAATDARLTALVDLVGLAMELDGADLDEDDARTRLATLRAPGDDAAAESAATTIEYQRRKVVALQEQVATARRERDEAVKQSERVARAADVWSEANWRMVLALNEAGCAREANGHTIMPEDRIRTLARERDEAAGVLRAMIQWQADMEREEEPVLFDSIIARARALMAGEAGPSKLDAIMTEREADLIGESFAAERELRATIETCRETISRQRAMIADALARLDEAGKLIERCLDAVDGNHMALRADLRAWKEE